MDRYLDPRSEGSPPALVVGTMNFGKRTPEPEAHRIVQRALERGLVVSDAADVYVDGESERILGRALGKRRPEARIATKVGIGKMSDAEGLAPERIAAALEESLRRLGTDRVELYYFHKPDHSRPLEPSLRAMEKVIKSGKAGAFGASNYASCQLLEMIHAGVKPRVSQQIYHLLARQLAVEYCRCARQSGVHTPGHRRKLRPVGSARRAWSPSGRTCCRSRWRRSSARASHRPSTTRSICSSRPC